MTPSSSPMTSSSPPSSQPTFTTISIFTWNIEGLGRNVFNLKHLTDFHQPDLIFLGEPQIYSCNLNLVMKPLSGEYESSLSSDDNFDHELPLIKSKASGGTMVMWKKFLDPHITVLPLVSSSFLPILFHPPGAPLTIHIAVYLPTSGKETEFVSELSKLSIAVEDLDKAFPEASKFIRGDFNVNSKNIKRSQLLDLFCSHHRLLQVSMPKPTYHHFTGEGKSDSFLDRVFFSTPDTCHESLTNIECCKENPIIDSHHDLIITKLKLPKIDEPLDKPKDNITAPKNTNTRKRVLWSEPGIEAYQKLVLPHLSQLQDRWLSRNSKTSISILLTATNDLLNSCAEKTNKTVPYSVNSTTLSR